jgi:hypothetical protein
VNFKFYFSKLFVETIIYIFSEFNSKCLELPPVGLFENNSVFPWASWRKKKEGAFIEDDEYTKSKPPIICLIFIPPESGF